MQMDKFKVLVKPCKNPSDMIWSNKGISRKEQLVRGSIIILIILIVSFIVLFIMNAEISA